LTTKLPTVGAFATATLLAACAFFEAPLDLEVRNESANAVVVTIHGGDAPDEYVVEAGETRVIATERPDGWSVWVDHREATSERQWPSDNPSIGLSIDVRADGSVDVVDD
jgi:hypothetical protein